MDEELGKWLLDISKYIITAYILAEMFGKDNDSIWAVVGAVVLAAASWLVGLYLIKKEKKKKKKKDEQEIIREKWFRRLKKERKIIWMQDC